MSESATLKPPMCLHPGVRYDAEKDNYYCTDCCGGMGLAYYKVARQLDALRTLTAAQSKALEKAEGIVREWHRYNAAWSNDMQKSFTEQVIAKRRVVEASKALALIRIANEVGK